MHDELKKLLRQSSHYLVGLVGSLAFGFISFPIFTRVFSVSDYGLIDLATKVVVLIVAVCKCGLQNSALRFFDRDAFLQDPAAGRRYYSTLFLTMALPAIAVTIGFVLLTETAPERFIDPRLRGALLAASGLIVLRSAQSLLWSFLRVEERTGAYNFYNLLIRGATVAAVCLLLPWMGANYNTYFAGTTLVEAIVVGLVLLPFVSGRRIEISSVSRALGFTSLAFGVPMVAQELAGIVLDAGDRAVVRHFLGDELLGMYSVAYGLSSYVNTLLMVPLGLAIIPIYMRLWKSEGEAATSAFLSRAMDGFLMAAALVQTLACLVAQDAVSLLASPKFAAGAYLIPWLVSGLLFYALQAFLNAGLLIHKRTKKMAVILIWSAIFNMALNWILVPRLGLVAAALATLLAYVFAAAWTARSSGTLLPLHVSWAALARYLAAGLIAWALAHQVELGHPFPNVMVRSVSALIAYAAVLYGIDGRVRGWISQALRSSARPLDPAGLEPEPY